MSLLRGASFGVNAHIRNHPRIGAPIDRVRDHDLLSVGSAGGHKLFVAAIGDACEIILGCDLDGGQIPDDLSPLHFR